MPIPYAKIIVNPMAAGGAIGRQWPQISRQLRSGGLSFDWEYTGGSGQATELARAAVDNGYGYIIAVGGDGTINEVANGMLGSPAAGSTMLGLLSAGTSSDFAHCLGIPENHDSACSLLLRGRKMVIDVGFVEYSNDGRSQGRYFLNSANVGFGAAVVDSWKNIPSRSGQPITYALRVAAGLGSLLRYDNRVVTLDTDRKVETIRGWAVVVANGRYFADRMLIAPQAKLNDGLLDMLVIGDISKLELLRLWPELYKGSHVVHPKVMMEKVAAVTVESAKGILVEADGELLGEGPVSFRVVPSALTVVA
jgi:YegS/Rv2252/BmrU family lipid kinase